VQYFSLVNGNWTAAGNVVDKLQKITNGWIYTTADSDFTEIYDVNGKLTSIQNRAGLVQTLTYDAQGLLLQVTDPDGRALIFAYDTSRRIQQLSGPDNFQITYHYDANNKAMSHSMLNGVG